MKHFQRADLKFEDICISTPRTWGVFGILLGFAAAAFFLVGRVQQGDLNEFHGKTTRDIGSTWLPLGGPCTKSLWLLLGWISTTNTSTQESIDCKHTLINQFVKGEAYHWTHNHECWCLQPLSRPMYHLFPLSSFCISLRESTNKMPPKHRPFATEQQFRCFSIASRPHGHQKPPCSLKFRMSKSQIWMIWLWKVGEDDCLQHVHIIVLHLAFPPPDRNV